MAPSTPPPFEVKYNEPPAAPHWGARYDEQLYERTPRRSKRLTHTASKTTSSSPIARATTPPPTAQRSSLRQSPRSPRTVRKTETITRTTTTTTTRTTYSGLPTPSKTPSKKKTTLPAPTTSARVLFPTSSSSKPKGGAFSLLDEAASEDIPIFEDSNARIPKATPDENNPFVTTRSSKRRKVVLEEEEQPSEHGMWSLKRGKKFWQEFETTEEDHEVPTPRRLFASEAQVEKEEEEEEEDEEDTDVPSSPLRIPDQEEREAFCTSEKDKVGKVTRSPEKTSKPVVPTTTPRTLRFLTPEAEDGNRGMANPFATPPSTVRRKRTAPAHFASSSDIEEETTPRASSGRSQSKNKRLRYDDDVIRPLQTPTKRVGRAGHGLLTPARGNDETPGKPRRV